MINISLRDYFAAHAPMAPTWFTSKIAKAKEEDGVGVLAFDVQVLLADGGDVVAHGLYFTPVPSQKVGVLCVYCGLARNIHTSYEKNRMPFLLDSFSCFSG